MKDTYKKNDLVRIISIILLIILLIPLFRVINIFFDKETNKETTFQSGMEMIAMPSVRFDEPLGIRFTTIITPELYNEVTSDENKDFGFVIAPLSYYSQVDVNNTGNCDWIKLFEQYSLKVMTFVNVSPVAVTESNGTLIEYRYSGSVADIKYKNTNLAFLGVCFVKTTNGENIEYKYASFENGLSYSQCGYSYSYLAAERLNAYIVNNEYLSQSDLDILNNIINSSVDYANGLSEPTEDNSTYNVTLSETNKTLKAGETFILEANIAENVQTPVWWQSSDQSVAIVKDGVVTAINNGTTTITAVIAGKKYTCLVTVI